MPLLTVFAGRSFSLSLMRVTPMFLKSSSSEMVPSTAALVRVSALAWAASRLASLSTTKVMVTTGT